MPKVYEYAIRTKKDEEFVDITYLVEQSLKESSLKEGIVVVFCPHTSAGITINSSLALI